MSEKSEKRVLTENFIAITLTQIISYIIPLITLPYLSRVLGAEKFGLVFWAQSFITYLMILTDFGFNLSAVKEFSLNRNNKKKMSDIFNSILVIKFGFIILSFIILLTVVFLVSKFSAEYMLFFLTFFMVIGNAIYPIYFFQGIEHMKYITFLNILAKTIFLVLIILLVKNPANYLYVPLLNSMGFMISGLIGIYLAIKKFNIKLYIPPKEEIIYQFKNSSEFFLSRISVCGFANTNSFVLGLITNPIMVAYYVAAEKIYSAIFGLTAPFSQVMYPHVAKEKNIKIFKKIYFLALVFMIMVSIFIFIFAKYIILIFYGQELINSYKLLRIFCVLLFFSSAHSMMGYPLLAGMGYSKYANFSMLYAAILHIVLVGILIIFHKITIYNVAIATIITEGFVLIYRM